jgi:hypothetical protein
MSFFTERTWPQLTHAVENELREEITSRTHDRWDGQENPITDMLVGRLRAVLGQTQIIGEREKVVLGALAFKARGKIETRFGDLAVLVDLQFWDGSRLEGVAFYEAKRRAWKGQKLESVTTRQLRRIDNNLWNAHLLAYDREPILSAPLEAITGAWWGSYRDWWEPAEAGQHRLPFTHAAVVRLGTALAYGQFDRSLYKLCLPFALQLCARNLQGLELDHDTEILKAVRGQSDKYDVPRVVLSVVVRQGPGQDGPLPPPVNEERLTDLHSDRR